jgi:5,10-methylene-tetrahydrofolate dehydrogenase/methenyl tetrahydrofolate cyclohydrolase
MKYLNGSEIAGFIKERQAKQVRSLSQAKGINLQLNIISCGDNLANIKYTSIKQSTAKILGQRSSFTIVCKQTQLI